MANLNTTFINKLNNSFDFRSQQVKEFHSKVKNNLSQKYNEFGDGVDCVKEKVECNFDLFVDKWNDYKGEVKHVLNSLVCTLKDKKERYFDGINELLNNHNHEDLCSKNKFDNIFSLKDNIIDNFENLIEKSKCLGEFAKNQVTKVEYLKEKTIDNFEDYVWRSKECCAHKKCSHLNKMRLMKESVKEHEIDYFEEFIDKSKSFSLKAREKFSKVTSLKERIIDDFEDFINTSKGLSQKTRVQVDRVNSLKDSFKDLTIDHFEQFIDKTKNLGFRAQNKLRKVDSLKENIIDDFEHWLRCFNTNRVCVEENVKCCTEEKKEYIVEGFENLADKIKYLSHKTKNKVNAIDCVKEEAINNFESILQSINADITCMEEEVKCYAAEKKENMVDEFEEVVCKLKCFGQHVAEHTNNKIKNIEDAREKIVDSFEDLVVQLNDVGLRTENEVMQKIECIKEEVVEDFDNIVEEWNAKIRCVEDNVWTYTIENKNYIVDLFEDMLCDLKHEISCINWNIKEKVNDLFNDYGYFFDEVKWTMDDRGNAIIENAECAFNEFVEEMNGAFEGGGHQIENELCTLKYWLLMGETLITEFLCYSERIAEEFFKFSEKRVAYYICEGQQKAKVFYNEVVDSLVRGFEDKLLCDNLVLEINSSRYAYNVTMSEVNFHVVRALLTLPSPDGNTWQHLVSRLTYFMPIFTNYIRTEAAQKDCLLAIEDVAGSNAEVMSFLVKIIHWLYEKDILSEDIIMDWYNNPCPDADVSNSRRVRQQVASFIRWLQEAEEDSDDDDDD